MDVQENQRFQVVVIGGGPGGYVAAIRAAQLGFSTACIEKEKTLGGTCLNVGCIPSKTLLQATEYFDFMANYARLHGIICDNFRYDFDQMMQRKEEVVDSLVDGVAALLKKNKVERINGTAKFIDAHTIEVSDGEHTYRIQADNIIIASGSEAIPLPFLPFDEKKILSSTGALALKRPPKKMIVIGAGVIGLELASVYLRLGTEITVIEMFDKICPFLDSTIGRTFQQILKKQGFNFFLGAKVLEGQMTESGVSLTVLHEDKVVNFDGDCVLVAIGRRPYTKGLNLDAANVTLSPKGCIVVDNQFRTSQPHILAIGDVVDGPMLAHKASEEGLAAAESLAGKNTHLNYLAIPNVIYTHPEVATVGFTEDELKEKSHPCFTGTSYFKGNARARCTGDTEGLVKIIGDVQSGRLLGLHIIGPHASEMIGEGVIALERGMTVEELANSSHAHPTLSEAIKEAAFAALKRPLHG